MGLFSGVSEQTGFQMMFGGAAFIVFVILGVIAYLIFR